MHGHNRTSNFTLFCLIAVFEAAGLDGANSDQHVYFTPGFISTTQNPVGDIRYYMSSVIMSMV